MDLRRRAAVLLLAIGLCPRRTPMLASVALMNDLDSLGHPAEDGCSENVDHVAPRAADASCAGAERRRCKLLAASDIVELRACCNDLEVLMIA